MAEESKATSKENATTPIIGKNGIPKNSKYGIETNESMPNLFLRSIETKCDKGKESPNDKTELAKLVKSGSARHIVFISLFEEPKEVKMANCFLLSRNEW